MELLVSMALTLFLVMDPIGNVPLFLSATRAVDAKRRQRIIARELIIALIIMVVFMFAGGKLLNLLSISQPAMSVAGGLVLLLIAIWMIFPGGHGNLEEKVNAEPLIVPMAVPYMAGPSVLATLVVLYGHNPDDTLTLLGALGISWLLAAVILYCAGLLQRVLGDRVLNAMERLMGMILVVMATQMLLSGIQDFFSI